MEFKRIKHNDGSVEYVVSGEVKSYFLEGLSNAVQEDIDSGGVTSFSFDFSDVDYLDSQGIRILVIAGKYNYQGNKKLIIKNPKDNIRRILELAEIKFIEIAD